jgi:tight adherence protein B
MSTWVTGLAAAVLVWATLTARGVRSSRRWAIRTRLTPSAARPSTANPTCSQWVEFLDTVAAEVRSGRSVATAVDRTVRRTATRHPRSAQPADADEAVVVAALGMAVTIGGPVAATLQQGATVLRERVALRAEAAVHAAQSRLSARVLTLLPVAVAGLGTLTSQSFRAALGSAAGTACAVAGLLVNAIGWRWMRREITRVGS